MELAGPRWPTGAGHLLLSRDEGLAKLEELGVELVGVSGDEAASHKLFKETYALKHSLLADTEGKLAKLLGVTTGVGGRTQAMTPDGMPQSVRILTNPATKSCTA